MVLRIYNTLSRKKEVFKPTHGNRVNMFVCGPTTYDLSHLGHARTYVSYDIIARYLRYKGYSLFYVMNITDVDDKIINRAENIGTEPLELAREYEKYFYEDMATLGIRSVNLFARASEHIPEIIDQMKTLIDKGYAYETETGVYYDITKFKDLGALSHQNPSELRKHRIEPDPTKRSAQDFALWKKRGPEELGWDSPWGRGRPGWHIEDTAITTHYFGPQYDIHGGAVELIFPHHEAEIAQAEAATGRKPLVKYWVHTGVLKVDGKKMSKSLGNFVTIRDALKRYDPEVLRFFFASAHYRSIIDFSEGSLEQAERSLQTLRNALSNVRKLVSRPGIEKDEEELEKKILRCRDKFVKAMDDDFNSPFALTALFDLANEVNKFVDSHETINANLLEKVVNAFKELGSIFNILQKEERKVDLGTVSELVDLLIELRQEFRENKDWQMSDKIRLRLKDLGIILEDTANGTRWKSAS
jgi:cysteinyl-tRNA synthetase